MTENLSFPGSAWQRTAGEALPRRRILRTPRRPKNRTAEPCSQGVSRPSLGTRSRLMHLVLLTCALALAGRAVAADGDAGKTVQLVLDLLNDKDKDIRALGLQQVREEAK